MAQVVDRGNRQGTHFTWWALLALVLMVLLALGAARYMSS
jgi:hypothetical protein